jgi:aminoglycoside 6'-N-acetyltransferase
VDVHLAPVGADLVGARSHLAIEDTFALMAGDRSPESSAAAAVRGVRLTLRPMELADLRLLEGWLHEPHFAQWFLQDSTIESELADNRRAILGEDPATVLVAELDGRAIGWAQHYRYHDYPDEVAEYGALPGEVGIDYGIGDPRLIGRGVGTRLIAKLVEAVRASAPGASIMTAPSAANRASCRVLDKNGFRLVSVRAVASEPNASPLAFYRLAGAPLTAPARG